MWKEVALYLAAIVGAVIMGSIGGASIGLPLGAVMATIGFALLIARHSRTII